ncbi:MAG: hypothetical protein FGM15_10150 [Chthoniobacterales bacterium]|nr:hypothetical protein [Chthoniobacterales bacterium]
MRFSTFKNDHRITEQGSLLPDSYATTLADSKNVSTGSEAVQRYALPNDDPAVFVFDIKPMEQTLIKRGIVQENFGKPGGGVEVIFCVGTGPDTVSLRPQTLPA